MKKLRKIIIVLLLIALLLPMFPFRASASGSYTLDVGDTKYLSFSSGGKAIISSFWESNAPNCVGFLNTYLTSCQIQVMSYTPLQPVVITCTYYYQDLVGNYIHTFTGYESFNIRINPSDCTVYLDPCGGSVSPSSITVNTGSTYGTLPTPTRTGCTFDGWYTSSYGGSRVYSSTKVTATSDHTLYAHWDYKSMTVTFDPNGGTVDTTSKTVTYNSTYGTLPTPVWEDHDFIGWFTEPEGGSQIKSSSYVSRTSNHTLYAHWLANEPPFTDVPAGSYYESPVLWAVENGITNGATETTFNPGGDCLRAQVVTFLHRAKGNPAPTSTSTSFTDVTSSDYFYNPVLWAVEKGITNGVSATEFGARNVCSRAQVVTFLWRADGSPEPKSSSNPFTDVKATDYFYKPVLWAVENGITTGVDATHFGPTSPCNRAQVVTFLYRAKDVSTNVPDDNDPNAHYTFELTSNASSTEIGFIKCDGSSFKAGEEIIFRAEPNFGYLVELEVSPANLEIEYIGMGNYSMIMPANDVAIHANFYPAEGDYHYITGQVSRCNVLAICDDDGQGNLIAKPGEHIYLYLIPGDGYPYVSFGLFVGDEFYEDMWYLGMIEDDPDYGDFHIIEFIMPDADIEIQVVCTATKNSNSSRTLVPKAFPDTIPSTVPKSIPSAIQ